MKQIKLNINNHEVECDLWTKQELEDEPEFYESLAYMGVSDNHQVWYDFEGDCFVACEV